MSLVEGFDRGKRAIIESLIESDADAFRMRRVGASEYCYRAGNLKRFRVAMRTCGGKCRRVLGSKSRGCGFDSIESRATDCQECRKRYAGRSFPFECQRSTSRLDTENGLMMLGFQRVSYCIVQVVA